ncbi:MAG: hypothetical protein IPM06_19660 [Rhizobiales bacterium]|nr:hypothetical protein [Hyphomicrobiales bacterium]
MTDTNDTPEIAAPVELRNGAGELQGRLFVASGRLEVLKHGRLTVYDLRTGQRITDRKIDRNKHG